MKRFLMLFALLLGLQTVDAKDYLVTDFGASGDGKTLNTRPIQAAIDYVAAQGGGRLVFSPGSFVSGTIYLKSHVTLHLERGASILGSNNPLDFPQDEYIKWKALIYALKQENIGITGEGTIDGRGYVGAINAVNLAHRGIIKDELLYDRVREWNRPENIYFRECRDIQIKGITLKDPASWNQTYDQCQNLLIDGITVDSKSYWNNDGLDVVDCQDVIIRNSHFDAADDAICFKSHDEKSICENVLVENCTARSSASALKFGTVSRGGFRNFEIRNLTVYDTYRSAITFASVDGGLVENILVDGLRSINTGNVIFIRIGNRWAKGKEPIVRNITIKNVYAEVPLTKPDAGYSYEGPVEDMPRNISPASIVGLRNYKIEDVHLENIEIKYPGGANALYAYRGLSPQELDSIPQMEAAYPEFSQFKELPAWGFYIRHAKNVTFKNVTLHASKQDYRPAIVADDLVGGSFVDLIFEEPGADKQQIFLHNTSQVEVQP